MDYTVIMRDAIYYFLLLFIILFFYYIFISLFLFTIIAFNFGNNVTRNAYIREHFKRVICQVLQSSLYNIILYCKVSFCEV